MKGGREGNSLWLVRLNVLAQIQTGGSHGI